MIRIGIIIAHNSLQELLPIRDELKDKCDIQFLVYENAEQIEQLYKVNSIFYDALLMNWFPYSVLKKIGVPLLKPTYYYVLNDRDLYKKMFSISLKYKNLNLNRVLTDFQLLSHEMAEMDVEEIFALYKKYVTKYLQSQTVDTSYYKQLLKNHIQLHKEGKVDLSITVFGTVYKQLQQMGYPVEFVTASQQTVIELIEKVIYEVSYEQFLANKMVVGRLTTAEVEDDEQKNQLIAEALHNFNQHYHVLLIIQEHDSFFELFILKKDLARMTDDFTFDQLAHYLCETLPFEISIGWGVGHDVGEARKKAILANHEAMLQAESSIIITSTNQMRIASKKKSTNEKSVEELIELNALSEQLGISILILKKIMTVIQKARTDEITSEDIAFHLGITIRSANRMLYELRNKQLAQLVYTKHEKQRGRPKKVYKIKLAK